MTSTKFYDFYLRRMPSRSITRYSSFFWESGNHQKRARKSKNKHKHTQLRLKLIKFQRYEINFILKLHVNRQNQTSFAFKTSKCQQIYSQQLPPQVLWRFFSCFSKFGYFNLLQFSAVFGGLPTKVTSSEIFCMKYTEMRFILCKTC